MSILHDILSVIGTVLGVLLIWGLVYVFHKDWPHTRRQIARECGYLMDTLRSNYPLADKLKHLMAWVAVIGFIVLIIWYIYLVINDRG